MVWRFLSSLPRLLAAALLAVITVVLMAGVIGRYSGLYSLVWIEELSRALFTWLAFMGACVGVQRNAHFRLGVIDELLPPAGARTARVLAQASLGLLGLCLIVLGIDLMRDSHGLSTNILRIPFDLTYAAIPVSGVFFVLFAGEQALIAYREDATTAANLS